jgi:serine/threonine protein kinase
MDTLKKIGPYQIIKRIAEGGMAEVYLGKTEARFGVSKLVAIKTTLQNGNPERLKEMFFNEIRMSANLNHQNIVKIHDFGEFNDRGYMAMEYINGVTLRQLMTHLREKNEHLSSSFVLYIIHQVALGLAYAYQSVDAQTGRQLKLIHRDISPHNILISFEGEVKIIDFGIATATKDKDLESSGQVKGKVAYMSPEQIQGKDVDSASDIFSLGIVLWELLTNERFFPGTTVADVKKAILAYDVDQIKTDKMADRSEELLGVLPIMLHQDLGKRAGDANELARLLGTVLSSLHPDFSALALADYLRDAFSEAYNENMQHIRDFISEAEKTMVEVATNTGPTEEYGDLDEFDTKIIEGSYRSRVVLEKLTESVPVHQSSATPQKDMWGSVDTSKNPSRALPAMPNYRLPKMPQKKQKPSAPFGIIIVFAVACAAVLMSGLSVGKSNLAETKAIPVPRVEVPSLAPILEQRAPTTVQQAAVNPATLNKKAPVYANRKGHQKGRGIASTRGYVKDAPLAKPMNGKKALDLEKFKYGLAYPSGTKCLQNCPIKIGSQGD